MKKLFIEPEMKVQMAETASIIATSFNDLGGNVDVVGDETPTDPNDFTLGARDNNGGGASMNNAW